MKLLLITLFLLFVPIQELNSNRKIVKPLDYELTYKKIEQIEYLRDQSLFTKVMFRKLKQSDTYRNIEDYQIILNKEFEDLNNKDKKELVWWSIDYINSKAIDLIPSYRYLEPSQQAAFVVWLYIKEFSFASLFNKYYEIKSPKFNKEDLAFCFLLNAFDYDNDKRIWLILNAMIFEVDF